VSLGKVSDSLPGVRKQEDQSGYTNFLFYVYWVHFGYHFLFRCRPSGFNLKGGLHKKVKMLIWGYTKEVKVDLGVREGGNDGVTFNKKLIWKFFVISLIWSNYRFNYITKIKELSSSFI
jgi:hypothetical protein